LSYAPSFQLVVRIDDITLLSNSACGRILYAGVTISSCFESISPMLCMLEPKLLPRYNEPTDKKPSSRKERDAMMKNTCSEPIGALLILMKMANNVIKLAKCEPKTLNKAFPSLSKALLTVAAV